MFPIVEHYRILHNIATDLSGVSDRLSGVSQSSAPFRDLEHQNIGEILADAKLELTEMLHEISTGSQDAWAHIDVSD